MKKIMIMALATATVQCMSPALVQANREKAAQARKIRAHFKETLTAGTLLATGAAMVVMCARGTKGSSSMAQQGAYAAGLTLAAGWTLAGLTGLAIKISKIAQQATAYLSDDDKDQN